MDDYLCGPLRIPGLAERFTGSHPYRGPFSRLVKQFDMLKPEADCDNKQRLAFAKAHANEMWQADTLYGPHVQLERLAGPNPPHRLPGRRLARLLSRPVLPGRKCRYPHRGPPRRLLQTRRAALPLRRQRLHLHLQGNHPNLRPRRLPARPHARCATARPREKSNDFSARVRDQFLARATGPEFAGSPQPPVHPLGRGTLQRPGSFRPGHEPAGPLRPGPQPRPLPAAQRGQRRTVLRRGRTPRPRRQHLLLQIPSL